MTDVADDVFNLRPRQDVAVVRGYWRDLTLYEGLGMKQRQERRINSPGQMTLLAAGDRRGPGPKSHLDKETHTQAHRFASEPADARLEGK